MLKKCIKLISVFLCAVLVFQSLEIGIFATTEQTEETQPEDEISCPCENCTEYECVCECESEEVCNCIQCKRTSYTEYDDFGNVIAEKSFDGTKTMTAESYVYSEDGEQLLSSTDSSGNTANYSYNEAGLVSTVTAGSSSGTATYDESGNLLSFSQNVSGLSDGNVMSNNYTYENDKVKTISHNGFTYEFEYDEQGNLIIAKIGTAILTQNTFSTVEENSLLTSSAFANGQSVSYSYDESGNITAVFYGETERYSYTYDEEGILSKVTDNLSGLETVYADNGIQLKNGDDNSLLFSITADENGNETHNIAGDSITYSYNSDYNSQTGVYTDTVSFENENELTDNGVVVNFVNQGNIVTNTDWFGRLFSKNLSLITSVDDEEFNIDSSFVYNYADTDTTASTKIQSITSDITSNENVISQQEYYEYDAVGNITGIYHLEDDEKVYYNKYYYDEANQIVREDNRLGEFSCVYTYDIGGNIVSRIRYPYTEGEISDLAATETHTYSYNNSLCGDVLTGYNGQSVAYDNIGNITQFDGKEYTWTAGRQLSRMRDTEDGSYIDYCYDDNGMLNSFSMYNPDGTLSGICYYFWDETKLIAMQMIEYSEDENGNAVASEALRSRVIYDSDGEPLGYLLNDAMPMLYTKNILGDITGIVNIETGQLMFNYVYDVFGNMEIKTPNETAGEALAAAIILMTNPLSYRGYLYAPMAGYSYYLGSRFYAPTLCRFMNADVYADTAQGVVATNMFAYCNNNPIMFTDPEGTLPSVTSLLKVVKKLLTKIVTVINFLNREKSFQDFINDINSIIIKKSEKTATKAYDVSILISPSKLKNTTKKEKEFYEAIYENYKIDKEGTIDKMVDITTEKFYQIAQREILFSDDCLYEKIEEHLKAFWWSIGIINTPNTIALLYAAKESKQQVAIACASIDIKETDPIYQKEVMGIKPQSTMFDYYNGIRDEYSATIYDPYYDKKHGREYFTIEWRMP